MRTLTIAAVAALLVLGIATAQQPTVIEVYKSPTCGCCGNWVEHLRQQGFAPKVTDVDDVEAVKRKHGVPDDTWSCHTALVEGYVVEGHVPAKEVQRLLKERPAVAGIAVPGMPAGSPGMEVASGRVDPFDVVSFDKKGTTKVFASYRK